MKQTFISGITFDETDFQQNLEYIRLGIKQEIAGILWGRKERAFIAIQRDSEIDEAIVLFDEAQKLVHNP